MVASATTIVDFSNGAQGWQGTQPADGIGGTVIDKSMGNGAPALHTVINNLDVSYGNRSNQAFIGDYSRFGSVTLGIDVIANSIRYGDGQETSRNFIVELRDYDNKTADMPFTSVWYNLGEIDASKGWQHLSVTIADTGASALPTGWGGYGSPDDLYGPSLPAGRTFADVLAGVDELVFTTLEPGRYYKHADFDIAVDNISISAVPEPSSYAMLLGGIGLMGWMRRRRPQA